LNLIRCRNYINYNVHPVSMFAVPWVLNDEDWALLDASGQLVFDRIRQAGSLVGWNATPELRRWLRDQIRELRQLEV